jgi:aminopeptidase N
VRPNSYIKIDNFYTATIYEKGAEVIRMLKTLIGAETFRAGMDLYFDRFDGQATTMEAFIECFAEVSKRDLSAFFAWYQQAGTPAVTLQSNYDAERKTLELILQQSTAPTPGQPDKVALPIPIQIGLIDEDGRPLTDTELVVLDSPSRTITIENVAREPIVSALRGFSAPVNLTTDTPAKDAYVLLAADPDLFNRWEAGQNLARDLILARAAGTPDEVGEERYAEALERSLNDQSADDAFKALLLMPPSEADLAVVSTPADPAAIHDAREALRTRMAAHLDAALRDLHGRLQDTGAFSPDATQAGRRALRNAVIELMSANPTPYNRERARAHFDDAGNMTDSIGGLCALMAIGGEAFEIALADFYDRWRDEPLVIDKWFSLQARDPAEGALGRVLGLTAHPAFEAKNPNRLRALVSTFANFNAARFHDPSGAGYRFLADQVLAVDSFNPNVAARLLEPLGQWARYTPELGALMRAELERITKSPDLSKNVFELASKALA